MADAYNLAQAGTLTPEQFAQQQQLNRQQQMANMLMQQSAQPQGQMISGRYVAPSWAQQLVPLANIMASKYIGEKADTKAAELAKQLREGRNAEQTAIMEKLNSGDTKGALGLATSSQYGAGKEFIPALVGNVIPKAATPTATMQEYDLAKSQGFKGSLLDFQRELKKEVNAPAGQVVETPNGVMLVNTRTGATTPVMAGGQPVMGKGNQTESQAKASVFRSQMVGASNELNDVYGKGFNPNSPTAQVATNLAGGIFNAITPAAAQQAKQAQNQWTEAYLRFKTGAGTNAHEVEANRKTYFPEFGDKPEQIAQKARMRAQAERDIGMAAGPMGTQMGAQAMPPAAPQANPAAPAQSGWSVIGVK